MKKWFIRVFFCLTLWQIALPVLAAEVVFYVTRHGKTLFNEVHRVQGWSDTPLSQDGVQVAEQLGRGLKGTDFVAVYSSDAGRARETAKVILSSKGTPMPITETKNLRETFFGYFEGDLDPNMWTPAAQHLGFETDQALMAAFSSGAMTIDKMMNAISAVEKSGRAENYERVKTRMQNALKSIADDLQQSEGGNVLVVSHGMAILAMLSEMTNTPLTQQLKNASVSRIRYTDDKQFIVETINDMSYVENGKTE